MPKHYRLLITGSIPLTFKDTDAIPHEPQQWHDLFESTEVSLYDLEGLTLQLIEKTTAEVAADAAELERKMVYARAVGERMRAEYAAKQTQRHSA